MVKTSKNKNYRQYQICLFVINIIILIATIIICFTQSQTTHDFGNYYNQQHTEQLDIIRQESTGKNDMAGVVISQTGAGLSISFSLSFTTYIIIPIAVALIVISILLQRSQKHLKSLSIITIIISTIALCSLFIFGWVNNIFFQYLNFLFATPSLPNLATAMSIITIPILFCIILISAIYTLSHLKSIKNN